tara:strand:+ start:9273 stop:9950 length:678 start_codon:yes stop_codon:yes gene_type:complete
LKKILFVINQKENFSIENYLLKHLSDFEIHVEENLPETLLAYDLIILWSYRKILENISNYRNIVVFHSSDLPDGKGWAPIFNTINRNKKFFVISGIMPADKVDSGDIICQAKFEIKDNHTAEILREFDEEISIIMIKLICEKFEKNTLCGKKQQGTESFFPRRKPSDNEINTKSSIEQNINFLRACEKQHPAFFFLNKTKYFISITPEKKPDFPSDLEITFFNKI